MMNARPFWTHVDTDQREGVLLVLLFKSWKSVANQLVMEAVDVGSSMFEALSRLASEGADAQSRLSMTVFAAYWSRLGPQDKATDYLGRWLPIDLSTRGTAIRIECGWMAIARARGEPGRELYSRTQLELASLVEALPEQERYPALPRSWDEVMSPSVRST